MPGPHRSAKPAFKSKGMQLGAKGAKKQADLLESLGGAPVPEERQSLMVGGCVIHVPSAGAPL